MVREECVVRLAEPADAAALGEAHAEAWLAAYGDVMPAETLAALAEERRTIWFGFFTSPRRFDFTVLVRVSPSMLEGFAMLIASRERDGWTEIRGFHFHPAAWGTGASVALMNAALDAVPAGSPVHLWTHRDTPRSHGFYEKVGFTRTGQARDLAFGETAVIPEVEYARFF